MIDSALAQRTLLDLLAIPGKSGHERAVAEQIIGTIKAAGVSASAIRFDAAHRRSPRGGEVGNLIVRLPGTVKGPRRLLMAHIDTVPLCVGAQPVLREGFVVSRDGTTALGGDDRAGASVILNALLTLARQRLPHPPLTFLWTVQEEVGLLGARHVSLSKLGGPQLCFNWDGAAPNMAVIGATGDIHIDIDVQGLASHAGAHPEDGVSAVTIAGMAIADLQQNGWLGKVVKGNQSGTSNIGFVSGGEATNVVTDLVTLRAEARSHRPRFRQRIVDAYQRTFENAARAVCNAADQSGHVTLTPTLKYEAFRMKATAPCVQAAFAAIERVGLEPGTRIIDGGVDANWMTAHGLPTVTLGCGQSGIHTLDEKLHLESYLQACRIAVHLASDGG